MASRSRSRGPAGPWPSCAGSLANELPIYTCNADDFANIDGFDVHPVPVPDSAE